LNAPPQTHTDIRLRALVAFLVDTGARIGEALTLTRDAVDLDNLLVKLDGKTGQRIVPISIEGRKRLYTWLRSHHHRIGFPTVTGRQLRYDNLRNDFVEWINRCNVPQAEGSFHAFRRYFAQQYRVPTPKWRRASIKMCQFHFAEGTRSVKITGSRV